MSKMSAVKWPHVSTSKTRVLDWKHRLLNHIPENARMMLSKVYIHVISYIYVIHIHMILYVKLYHIIHMYMYIHIFIYIHNIY